MKQFKTIIVLTIFLSLTARSFSQTPDRVLSAEEFRQQKIEEKRKQLHWAIQVRENDWMRFGHFAGQINEYIFLENAYSFREQIQAIEGQENELSAIINASNESIKKMFFEDVKDFFFLALNKKFLSQRQQNLMWDEKRKIEYEKFAKNFIDTFAISPDNREKVAQAIRDYRLAEFIKNELPDIEAERNVSTGNYRFIGFTIGIGLLKGYSDKYDYYAPVSSGDHSIIPTFNVDANFRYMNLYKISSDFHVGFILDFGIETVFRSFLIFLGSDVMLGIKLERLLIGMGGYLYFRLTKMDDTIHSTTQYKKIDTGLIFSVNGLLGSRMNYLLGLDIRVNINKFVIHKSDEVGHVSILFKFGYGF